MLCTDSTTGERTWISREAMWRPESPPLPERQKEGLPGAPAPRGDEAPELGGRGGLPAERWRSSANARSASTFERDASSSATFACKQKQRANSCLPKHMPQEAPSLACERGRQPHRHRQERVQCVTVDNYRNAAGSVRCGHEKDTLRSLLSELPGSEEARAVASSSLTVRSPLAASSFAFASCKASSSEQTCV